MSIEKDKTPAEKSFQGPAKSEIKDIAKAGKDLASTEAENVKGGRMRLEPEVTKNDTTDMYA